MGGWPAYSDIKANSALLKLELGLSLAKRENRQILKKILILLELKGGTANFSLGRISLELYLGSRASSLSKNDVYPLELILVV